MMGDADILSSIVAKLGHDIDAIRERALKSLIFKLEQNIIVLEQLCIEPDLCRNLLIWFNKDVVKDEDVVLDLLYQISKHPISGNRLISIGAESFLESLRDNSPSSLHSKIDRVLDSLAVVPPLPPTSVYEEYILPSKPSQHVTSPSHAQQSHSHLNESISEKIRRQAKLLRDVEEDVDIHLTSYGVHDSEYVFPEVPTSREDDQFLKEISVKIQMTDPKMVSICLTQLQEEVLEDFPPEILLQKPDIFKGMLLQLQPSAFHKQLFSALHFWVYKLKCSLRVNLDHSFQSHSFTQAEEDEAKGEEKSKERDAEPPRPASSFSTFSYSSQPQSVNVHPSEPSSAPAVSKPGLTPAQAVHHVMIKALALATQFPLLADVIWLCKSLLSFLKPHDFEKQDVARYGEYFKLIELAVMEYKERMSTDPICASFLSLVVALLQPWPPARVSSIMSHSLATSLCELVENEALYLLFPSFRDEFRPFVAVLEYPQDPFRTGGNLSPVSTATTSSSASSTTSLTAHAQRPFEELRRATSQADMSDALMFLRELCIVDSFHLRCVWEVKWESYLKRYFAAPHATPEDDVMFVQLLDLLALLARSRPLLSPQAVLPNLEYLLRASNEFLAPLVLNEHNRRTNTLRLSILNLFKALFENPVLRQSKIYASIATTVAPILLSLACATSCEAPSLANMTTFTSFDSSDSRQARSVLNCIASSANYVQSQVWRDYTLDFLTWIVRLFAHKRNGASFRGRSILRAALFCLRSSGTKIDWSSYPETPDGASVSNIKRVPPSPRLSEFPKCVDDVAAWCVSLLGDREAAVRGMACGVLNCIAAHPRSSLPLAPSRPTSPIFTNCGPPLVHNIDTLRIMLEVGCDDTECYEVRTEAFCFVANVVSNFLSYSQHSSINLLNEAMKNNNIKGDNDHNGRNEANDHDISGEKTEDGQEGGEFQREAIIHRRIISALHSVHFFEVVGIFLGDTHAAPTFLHAIASLVWVLLCLDSGVVPRALLREGVWPLVVELLDLGSYWDKYRQCWAAFWEIVPQGAARSMITSQVPEWAMHQWQELQECHISGACERVFECVRLVVYDDSNMRSFFSKNARLLGLALDILLADDQFVNPRRAAVLMLNNLAHQATLSERECILAAKPASSQNTSIWQVLARNLEPQVDTSLRESVCQLLASLLDNPTSSYDSLEATMGSVPSRGITKGENVEKQPSHAINKPVGAVITKYLVDLFRDWTGESPRPFPPISSGAKSPNSLSGPLYAIQNLLGCSKSAKKAAIDLGFLQFLYSTFQQELSQLYQPALPAAAIADDAAARELVLKVSNIIQEMKINMHILRNFLSSSEVAQEAAHQAGFNEIFYSFVHYTTHVMEKQAPRLSSTSDPTAALLLQQTSLLTEIMAVLSNYTYHQTDTFKSAILHQHKGEFPKKTTLRASALVAPSQKGPSEGVTSILSMLGDFATKPKTDMNEDLFDDIVVFIGSVSDCPAVRSSVLKTSLFAKCVELVQKQALYTKHPQPRKLHSSLQFLVSLSFEQDVQLLLMKTKGFLDCLFDLLECRDEEIRLKCMLLLRNLSFASENKPFILASDSGLQLIANCVNSSNIKMQCYSTSLLWSLLHSNQRASVKLKKIRSLVDSLQQLATINSVSEIHTGTQFEKAKLKNTYQQQILENVEMILLLLGMRTNTSDTM